jgi:hypothetical protein
MRRVHFEKPGTWCWKCHPYRPGAAILPAIKKRTPDRPVTRPMAELLKAFIFIAIGYGWAATAYGMFPGG